MDHRGTVFKLINYMGGISVARQYDAFGLILSGDAGWSSEFGYQTNWKTVKIGSRMYCFSRYRIYDPETSVFLSRDWLPYLNKYRCWSNNPVGQVDRDGKSDVGADDIKIPEPIPSDLTPKSIKDAASMEYKHLKAGDPMPPIGENDPRIQKLKADILKRLCENPYTCQRVQDYNKLDILLCLGRINVDIENLDGSHTPDTPTGFKDKNDAGGLRIWVSDAGGPDNAAATMVHENRHTEQNSIDASALKGANIPEPQGFGSEAAKSTFHRELDAFYAETEAAIGAMESGRPWDTEYGKDQFFMKPNENNLALVPDLDMLAKAVAILYKPTGGGNKKITGDPSNCAKVTNWKCDCPC